MDSLLVSSDFLVLCIFDRFLTPMAACIFKPFAHFGKLLKVIEFGTVFLLLVQQHAYIVHSTAKVQGV